MEKSLIIAQQEFVLSPLRAAFWKEEELLILADLHLGKTGFFRTHGIPIPSTIMVDDLKRIEQLLQLYQPKELLVVGDMFHHHYNDDFSLFKNWRDQFPLLTVSLVPGNHDRIHAINYHALGIRLYPEVHRRESIKFMHDRSSTDTEGFVVSGHLHPGYSMAGRARKLLRLPCFIYGRHQLILPAFSAFTGLYTNHRFEEEVSYEVIADNQLYSF